VGGTAGGALAGRASAPEAAVAVVTPDVEATSLEQPVVTTTSDISGLVETALPSVVRIDSTTSLGTGTGTGFVLTADGQIATNAHVVGDAATVDVVFSDGTEATATVLGTSQTDDLAVIEVDRNDLVPVEFGSSDELQVGQRVVAIGNSLGLDGSATATDGIVSAIDRDIVTEDGSRLSNLIQTDAAINPGNSGGPLFTLDGKVVGINSAGSPSAQNIGFAIAADPAKEILDALSTGEPILKPFLGISSSPVTPELAAQLDLDADQTGAVVIDVNVGSAAEMAGLRAGDVIISMNGDAIDSPDAIGEVIGASEPDDALTIEVLRGGETITIDAVLGARRA
ncbi:S1C family serine protease, partial [Ilumatobacter sp.]|uniref:S1C family serine protease n=1 Tax=Ilumatobacter sp. TaxID=1967498 RepID=UPI003C516CD4